MFHTSELQCMDTFLWCMDMFTRSQKKSFTVVLVILVIFDAHVRPMGHHSWFISNPVNSYLTDENNTTCKISNTRFVIFWWEKMFKCWKYDFDQRTACEASIWVKIHNKQLVIVRQIDSQIDGQTDRQTNCFESVSKTENLWWENPWKSWCFDAKNLMWPITLKIRNS